MKCAFVVKLGPKTDPSENQLEGWVEEVDTGNDLRFHSGKELLQFLGERFQALLEQQTRPLDGRSKSLPGHNNE